MSRQYGLRMFIDEGEIKFSEKTTCPRCNQDLGWILSEKCSLWNKNDVHTCKHCGFEIIEKNGPKTLNDIFKVKE